MLEKADHIMDTYVDAADEFGRFDLNVSGKVGKRLIDPGNAVTRLFRGAFPVFVSSSAMIVIFTYAACFAVPNRSIASSRARSPSQ